MVSTRAFIVVATCLYLKRVAEKKATLAASRAVLEVEEDLDSGYTGESANLMEWIDLRSLAEAQVSNIPSVDVSETAVAFAFPFPKDSLRLRNAAVCSIIKSHDPPVDDSPTLADVARSIMDNFWQGAELDLDDDDTNSDLGADANGDFNGEDWDAWTGITRLRNPAPTATSLIMTLPTLVTPPLSTSSETQYAISSVFRTATSTMGSIFSWTCGVAYSRGSGYSKELAHVTDEYPLGSVTRMALSGPSYTQVEDEGESEMDVELPGPLSTSSQLKRPAIAVAAQTIGFNPLRRTGGWMRVDVDDIV